MAAHGNTAGLTRARRHERHHAPQRKLANGPD